MDNGLGPHLSVGNGEAGIIGSSPPVIDLAGALSEPRPSDEGDRSQAAEASDVRVHQGNDEDEMLLSPDSNHDPIPETTLTPLGELIKRRILDMSSNPNRKPPPYEMDGESST